MQTWQKILTAAAVSLVLAALCFFGGVIYQRKATLPVEGKPDTVWRTRTIHVPSPAPIAQRVLDTRLFFVAVPVIRDSIAHEADSCIVELPVEQKEYGDSTYHAWVSGYRPQLDSITFCHKTQIITTTVRQKAPRFSIGVSAGPMVGFGITPAGWQPVAGAGIIVGVQYRF